MTSVLRVMSTTNRSSSSSSSSLGFLLPQKWRVVNEREKTALCIPVPPSLALILSYKMGVNILF
jgi:hypothetical protein